MILVSTPGTWNAVYTPLDHAAWNGWTPTDLVFPFLLFAMGAAVPLALARRRRVPQLVRRHVIRRAAILFALGLVLNAIEGAPAIAWATFRIPGVLQRIALVYLAVAWLTERVSLRGQNRRRRVRARRLLGRDDARAGPRRRRGRAHAGRQPRVVCRPCNPRRPHAQTGCGIPRVC